MSKQKSWTSQTCLPARNRYFAGLPGGQRLYCSWPVKRNGSNPSVGWWSCHDSEIREEKPGSCTDRAKTELIKVVEECNYKSTREAFPLETVLNPCYSMRCVEGILTDVPF